MGPVRFILDAHQFRVGVVVGLLAAAAVVAGATLARRRSLAVAGSAFALAAFVALSRSGTVAGLRRVPLALLAGVALAYVLADLAGRIRPTSWFTGAAALPGAIVTAGALVGVPGWIRVVVAGFGAIGAAALGEFDRSHVRGGVAPVMWLITVGAVYSTVPDTEAARALLGVAIPIALLGWPGLYARFGAGGAAASACMLGWVIGQGGVGRSGSVVGAAGTLALFALQPLVRWLRTTGRDVGARSPDPRSAPQLVPLVGVHLVVALAAARWAGLAHSAGTATVRLLVVVPFALLLTRLVDGDPAAAAPRMPPAPPHRAHHPR